MSGFVVVIPARYASTRLPGKPLRLLAGRPMIAHVYERAIESGADEVIIATDDERIMEAAQGMGADCQMTAPDHRSGTDRMAEVIDARGYPDDRIIVNLQGDEPCMPGALVRQVAEDLSGLPEIGVATLCERIETAAELFDPHVVKVVTDAAGFALYFSRAVIPWDREAFSVTTEELPGAVQHFRHIGLYAYRAGFIREYVRWAPSPIECMEVLEQLRVLWNGHRIHVARALSHPGHGVDTEYDLDRVAEFLLNEGNRSQ